MSERMQHLHGHSEEDGGTQVYACGKPRLENKHGDTMWYMPHNFLENSLKLPRCPACHVIAALRDGVEG